MTRTDDLTRTWWPGSRSHVIGNFAALTQCGLRVGVPGFDADARTDLFTDATGDWAPEPRPCGNCPGKHLVA